MGYKTYTCPIAARCGGCETLAVPYPLQLKRKQAYVAELFAPLLESDCAGGGITIGDTDLSGSVAGNKEAGGFGGGTDRRAGSEPVNKSAGNSSSKADGGASGASIGPVTSSDILRPIVGMNDPRGFRHKAATPFAPGPKGSIRSGFYARGTHRIVRCTSCLTEDPRCRRVLNSLARTAELARVSAYDEDAGRGLLRHAVVRAGWKTDELLLTIVANGERLPREKELVRRIVQYAPDVSAIALNVNMRRTNAILGPTSRALWRGGMMHDELLGVRFAIGPTSFYQTNPAQTERLYDLAIRGIKEGLGILDTEDQAEHGAEPIWGGTGTPDAAGRAAKASGTGSQAANSKQGMARRDANAVASTEQVWDGAEIPDAAGRAAKTSGASANAVAQVRGPKSGRGAGKTTAGHAPGTRANATLTQPAPTRPTGRTWRLLDAYCGIGTIGLCAAAQVPGLSVVGVESVAGAVDDARRNARENGFAEDRCRFVCADATEWMHKAAARGEHLDAVIMDPPRAGSTPEFLAGLAALAPQVIVYVSCNPATQVRDLGTLLTGGYELRSLTPVDMFPHTKHVETVAMLTRR